MIKTVPKMTSDEEAERFLDQDLSDLEFARFEPMQFEFEPKTERINMRLPTSLLLAVKKTAAADGLPYQRFIRQTLERAVAGGRVPPKA